MRLLFDPALAWQELWAEGPDELEGILDGSLTDDGERLLLARFERPVLVTDPYRVSASWRVTELASLEVPLKVYAVTSGLTRKSRAWMDFLDAEEGLCRESAPRDGYDTWQTLKVLRCQPG